MVAEDFAALKEVSKLCRSERLRDNEEALPAVREWLAPQGLEIKIMSEYHWNLYRGRECLVQFWPTKNKFQNVSTGKIEHGNLDDMVRYAVRRMK